MAITISGIYMIRNTINNKLYIGQSVDIVNRWRHHKWMLNNEKHSNIHLQRAWKLDGPSSFEFSVISTCLPTVKALCEAEQYWMDLLTPEYNMSPSAGSTLGIKLSEEHKEKISKAIKGIKKSDTMRAALKQHWHLHKDEILEARGTVSEETKQKMSEAHSGENHHFFGITGEANPNFGKERSDEFKQKMSKLHKGEVKSEEHKAKISATLSGVPLSDERKQQMREGWKKSNYKQTPEQIAKRVAATKATKLKTKTVA